MSPRASRWAPESFGGGRELLPAPSLDPDGRILCDARATTRLCQSRVHQVPLFVWSNRGKLEAYGLAVV